MQHPFSSNLNKLSYRREIWNFFCRCRECLCLLQTVLELQSPNANTLSHFLQFLWPMKTKQWCTEQHEFQWSALPKPKAHYSRQAVLCKTQLINENLESLMFVTKVSYSPINILKFLFILFVCVCVCVCLINVSSVESDLRNVYIQFLKNFVFFCGLKMPGFLPLQF